MFKYKSLYKNFANENHMAKFVKKVENKKEQILWETLKKSFETKFWNYKSWAEKFKNKIWTHM